MFLSCTNHQLFLHGLQCSPTYKCDPCLRQDARFVDPLMDVGTPREIHLAFYSLIKLFSGVDVEKKSVTWAEKPELPSHMKASELQQVRQLSFQKSTSSWQQEL